MKPYVINLEAMEAWEREKQSAFASWYKQWRIRKTGETVLESLLRVCLLC